MRKIFAAAVMAVFVFAGCSSASVEADPEVHRVIGGLYSLVCALDLNGNYKAPHINQLRQFFTDIPDGWHNEAQISRVNKAVWVGVSVGKYSTARQYLREHSAELGIMESPEGYAWLGGEYAWLKASGHGSLTSARGSGKDSGLVFLSTDGMDWWMAHPTFTKEAANTILRRWGARRVPELHRPSGTESESLYESVKPADVVKPKDIHYKRRRSSFDMEIGLGKDVYIDPVPNRRRR